MLLRNDDVSADTDLAHLKKFCATFDKFGLCQTHGILLKGETNTTAKNKDGHAVAHPKDKPSCDLTNKQIKRMAQGHSLKDRPELVEFINNRWQDEIALHGVRHEDYTKMEDPAKEIALGLAELARLFPKKKVRVFIPPFNRVSKRLESACEKNNLQISAEDGVHLETDMDTVCLDFFKTHRYHHHRFAPNSLYAPASLNYATLDKCFRRSVAADLNIPGIGPAEVRIVCDKHKCSNWFWTNYTPRTGICFMLGLLANTPKKDALKVLDIGPGLNLNLARLYCLGFKNIRGIELSESHIAGGKDIFDAPITRGDITKLRPKDVKDSNVVTCFTVIPGIENFDYAKFLRTIAKGLKPGGLLLMDSVWPTVKLPEYRARISVEAFKAFATEHFDVLLALHEEGHVNRDWWVLRKR